MKKTAYQQYDVFSALHPEGVESQEYYRGIRKIVPAGQEGITGNPDSLGGNRTRPISGQKKNRKKIQYRMKKASLIGLDTQRSTGDNYTRNSLEEVQMTDEQAAGQMISEAFHDEMKKIAGLEKDAALGAALKGLAKGIGSAAKAGVTSGKASLRLTAKGKRGVISRYAKAVGTGAKRFGKKLTPGQAAALAGGAGVAGGAALS